MLVRLFASILGSLLILRMVAAHPRVINGRTSESASPRLGSK